MARKVKWSSCHRELFTLNNDNFHFHHRHDHRPLFICAQNKLSENKKSYMWSHLVALACSALCKLKLHKKWSKMHWPWSHWTKWIDLSELTSFLSHKFSARFIGICSTWIFARQQSLAGLRNGLQFGQSATLCYAVESIWATYEARFNPLNCTIRYGLPNCVCQTLFAMANWDKISHGEFITHRLMLAEIVHQQRNTQFDAGISE
jgi:hypothetical protein